MAPSQRGNKKRTSPGNTRGRPGFTKKDKPVDKPKAKAGEPIETVYDGLDIKDDILEHNPRDRQFRANAKKAKDAKKEAAKRKIKRESEDGEETDDDDYSCGDDNPDEDEDSAVSTLDSGDSDEVSSSGGEYEATEGALQPGEAQALDPTDEVKREFLAKNSGSIWTGRKKLIKKLKDIGDRAEADGKPDAKKTDEELVHTLVKEDPGGNYHLVPDETGDMDLEGDGIWTDVRTNEQFKSYKKFSETTKKWVEKEGSDVFVAAIGKKRKAKSKDPEDD